MRVFLSYASQDRTVASAIHRALLHEGHDVFFDREDLPPGEEYHSRIRRAIERSKLMVFLISEAALDTSSYTLNELEIAQTIFPRAHGRLLPVLLAPVDFTRLPEYLKSVTVLQTQGDVVAAVADAVHRIARVRRAVVWRTAALASVLALLAAGGLWLALRPGPQPSEIVGADAAPAVLIPAGSFVMGDGENSPRREVFLGPYYIDRYEVTTGRYAKFLAHTGSPSPPENWQQLDLARGDQLPVIGVDWHDASAYCVWAGKRLPTEAEWEKAARGAQDRRYPWGDESPTPERSNFQNASPLAYDGGLHQVGAHPAGRSAHGVHDMAGNANEWVADWYADSFPAGSVRSPRGPESGRARVIRGGGRFDAAERLLAAKRYHAAPETRADDIGFRCAADAR